MDQIERDAMAEGPINDEPPDDAQLPKLGTNIPKLGTTPTQEQIEAAAEKIWEDFCGRIGGDWKYLGDNAVVKNQCKATAKAALEAAAGVGDKPQTTFPHGTLLVNATIERCAQWLDDNGFYAGAIAMRRALKEDSLQPPRGQNPVVKDGSKAGHVEELPTQGDVAPTSSDELDEFKYCSAECNPQRGHIRACSKYKGGGIGAFPEDDPRPGPFHAELKSGDTLHMETEFTDGSPPKITVAAVMKEKWWQDFSEVQQAYIERKIELAKLDERERCARVADRYVQNNDSELAHAIAAAIRALKDKS